MSVFNRGKMFYMKFTVRGQFVCQTTGSRSRQVAERIERETRRAMELNAAGIPETARVPLFAAASTEWLDFKEGTVAASSLGFHTDALKHLLPAFGARLLSNFTREEIKQYQRDRLKAGAARKTVNLELETLRAILIHFSQWERIKRDVKMLKISEEDEVGIELTEEEQSALLTACQESDQPALFTIVTLALEAGPRSNTIMSLRWKWVNLNERCLKWGKDKTPQGSGRVVPLSDRAVTVLEFWASQFPNRKPDHFVFPSGYMGESRSELSQQRRPSLHRAFDPNMPIGSIKTAWNTARRNAAWILEGRPASKEDILPMTCRFHDLRHTAESRMIRKTKGNIPLVARIMGWSASTMVAMAKKYSHFRVEELRDAVEAFSGNTAHETVPKTVPTPCHNQAQPDATGKRVTMR